MPTQTEITRAGIEKYGPVGSRIEMTEDVFEYDIKAGERGKIVGYDIGEHPDGSPRLVILAKLDGMGGGLSGETDPLDLPPTVASDDNPEPRPSFRIVPGPAVPPPPPRPS